jgi:hypothetical protein
MKKALPINYATQNSTKALSSSAEPLSSCSTTDVAAVAGHGDAAVAVVADRRAVPGGPQSLLEEA